MKTLNLLHFVDKCDISHFVKKIKLILNLIFYILWKNLVESISWRINFELWDSDITVVYTGMPEIKRLEERVRCQVNFSKQQTDKGSRIRS